MEFTAICTGQLPLNTSTHWIWFSGKLNAFVVGDEHLSFTLPPPGNVHQAEQLVPSRVEGPPHGCDLPLPEHLLDQFLAEPWHGFRWLDRRSYASAVDPSGMPAGDLLRTVVFGPDYGQYLRLPSSEAVIAMRSGSLRLLQQRDGTFTEVDHVKTRGRAALAYAAHPSEPFIVYGDNVGEFFAHQVGSKEFGKTSKIAEHGHKASQVEFIDGGATLLVGGMGYLAAYVYTRGKFILKHEHACTVRSFCFIERSRQLIVNQGIHGVSVLALSDAGFSPVAELPTDAAVHALAVSGDGASLGLIFQDSWLVSIQGLVE